MKKVWSKLLVVCMAAVLAVGVCFALTACDEGEAPTSKKYTYDSVGNVSSESFSGEELGYIRDSLVQSYSIMFKDCVVYFEGGKFVMEIPGNKQEAEYREENGVYYITSSEIYGTAMGGEADMYFSFDETTLTLTSVVTIEGYDVTAEILFKA